MKVVTPIAPAIPATTAIQDPAARRFAQAVSDALSAMQSSEGSVRTLTKAAEALAGATASGVPAGIAQWLFSSELYAKLSSEIVRVDLAAKEQTIAEALARQEAIDAIQATLADIGSTAAYDPGVTYAVSDMVTFDSKLYRAKVATTGNLPTDTAFWEKVGDYATLGDVVAAHTLSINDHESRIDATEAGLSAEVFERSSLAAQVRGGYSGTDANEVTQGLIYSERIARASADSTEVAARQSLSAKLTGATDPTGLTLGTLASGLVFDEKTARVSAVGAVATSVSALEGRTSATEGAILAEQSVRAGNDNALVSAINTMWAITGATTAISTSGSNLVTNWTSGQANYWNTLNAEVFTTGGQTIRAALSQEATVRASQTGDLYGQYTVKIDTNGYVAGFGLASSSSTAGVGTSSFVIRADKFAMVMPGYGDYVPFAVGPAGVSFNGSMAWGGITGRPSDSQLLNNLINPGSWSAGDGASPGFACNGSVWENYREPKTAPDGSKSMAWSCFPGRHYSGAWGWDGTGYAGSGPAGDADGGWDTDLFSIDRTKVYRFSVWVRRYGGTTGSTYFGSSGGNTAGLQTYAGTVDGNPYFWNGLLPTFDRWHLLVGYVFPEGLQWQGQGNKGGVWDSVTGKKVYPGTDFLWNAGQITAIHRAYLFYSAPGCAQDMIWPRVDLCDGSEPSIDQLLAMSAISGRNPITNSNVTTYIDNAAIQNAQIGGNIWSSNYVAGSAGWIIDRTGYAEFRNILARGNIEATSIKADAVDIVSTLHLQGEAVTVPRSAYTAAEIGVGTGTTVQSCYINAAGQPVSITGSITALIISNGASTALVLELYAPGGSLISSGNAGAGMAGLPLLCTISVGGVCSEVGTYTLKTKTYAGSAFYASNRFLQLLGTKR